jgi:hypothetical protein
LGLLPVAGQIGGMHALAGESSLSGSPASGARGASAAGQPGRSGPALLLARDPGIERLSIAIVPPRRFGAGSGGALPDVPQGQPAHPRVVKPSAGVDADLIGALGAAAAVPEAASGWTTPWHPASRPGGGAALPPRGGSGSGAQSTTVAAVQGHVPAAPAPSAPAAPPAIPGVLAGPGSPAGSAASLPAPTITRNAAAQQLLRNRGGTAAPAAGSTGLAGTTATGGAGGGSAWGSGGLSTSASGTGPTIIPENPSSLPSSSVGNGPGAMLSFPYFPLYILDANNGVVLFNGQY